MNSWHMIDDGEKAYSLIDFLVKTMEDGMTLSVYLEDGTVYNMDSNSNLGIQTEAIIFKLNEEDLERHVLINTNYITHIEVIKDDVVE